VLLLLIPAAFLLIGPGEELLFRGVVQGTLRRAFDPVPAIAIAAAVFAAIHYFALAGPSVGRVATIGVLFLPSLVFGAVYEYTDNLVVPSLIHGAYDATLFAVLYAVIRYGGSIDALSETREAAATLALLQ
jgi:membrane protease YdiL (CAAX protease family)